MIDRWFSTIELPLTWEQFHQLPQNAAYKYEYFDGHAWLTPRPKTYHGLLDLRSFDRTIAEPVTEEKIIVRPLVDEDWPRLPPLFTAAFGRVQPFAGLADEARLQAATECLQQTQAGTDGPLIAAACLVAACESDDLVGALLATLAPPGDPLDWGAWRWRSPPPADVVARRAGRPHLTWLFVSPWFTRQGVGTALLDAAVRALVGLGYQELCSSFLLGNESSTLWHWRSGFRLLPYPG
jgi:GNAT superfamily N-acetyltransferase